MGAPSKRAKKIRTDDEFSLRQITALLSAPIQRASVYSWALDDIFEARDQQLLGRFARPSQLAAALRTDDALFVARANRLAPQRCTKVEIIAAAGARGASIAKEAEALYGENGIATSESTLADINGCLVDHGIAFAYNVITPREDGSRVDFEVRYWPIEHVRWDPLSRTYKTRVNPVDTAATITGSAFGGWSEVEITPNDGRWIMFSAFEDRPFAQDAAILPASLVWARHAFAVRDWAKSSVAHGSAKVIGEMPEGVALQNKDGMTPEAQAMLTLLKTIASSDAPVGIRPAGSKTDFLTNTSTAWQIFKELVENAEKAAARIYLGTDGILGSQGGAPGVDVQALLGVAATKVQGDFTTIGRGLKEGSIDVWCAMNFGDSSLAPERRYVLPDDDADADTDALAKRRQAFYAELWNAKQNGVQIDQPFVDDLATQYRIKAPTMANDPNTAPLPASAPAAPAAPAAAPALRSVS